MSPEQPAAVVPLIPGEVILQMFSSSGLAGCASQPPATQLPAEKGFAASRGGGGATGADIAGGGGAGFAAGAGAGVAAETAGAEDGSHMLVAPSWSLPNFSDGKLQQPAKPCGRTAGATSRQGLTALTAGGEKGREVWRSITLTPCTAAPGHWLGLKLAVNGTLSDCGESEHCVDGKDALLRMPL